MATDWLDGPDETEAEASPSIPSPILYNDLQNPLVEPAKPILGILYPPLQNRLANQIDPTSETYSNLGDAYDFFNERLFDSKLPRCLITLQRSGKARAFYHHERFGAASGTERVDEIGMNPRYFLFRSTEETLSTLVHEMCHVKQFHFGKASRNGYHNKEFAKFMDDVGLVASDTGAPGGKPTGQRMSHYIKENGAFARACRELIDVHRFVLTYGDVKGDPRKTVPGEPKPPKPNSGITYICTTPACAVELKGKPGEPFVRVLCVDCNSLLIDKEKLEQEDYDENDTTFGV